MSVLVHIVLHLLTCQVFVPEVDSLLRGAGEEQAGVEGVPHDSINWGDVGSVGHQVGGRVLGGHEVDVPLLSRA